VSSSTFDSIPRPGPSIRRVRTRALRAAKASTDSRLATTRRRSHANRRSVGESVIRGTSDANIRGHRVRRPGCCRAPLTEGARATRPRDANRFRSGCWDFKMLCPCVPSRTKPSARGSGARRLCAERLGHLASGQIRVRIFQRQFLKLAQQLALALGEFLRRLDQNLNVHVAGLACA
jgi:hypothetical protein